VREQHAAVWQAEQEALQTKILELQAQVAQKSHLATQSSVLVFSVPSGLIWPQQRIYELEVLSSERSKAASILGRQLSSCESSLATFDRRLAAVKGDFEEVSKHFTDCKALGTSVLLSTNGLSLA
jgi:hypothetical protein